MSNLRELVTDIENTSKKVLKTNDHGAEEHLFKILGEVSTDRMLMNDVGVMLKADSQQYMGDSGFPSIDVLFSPDSLPNDKHVVDIQFRKRDVGFAKLMALVATAGDCATPDIEWSEATKH